MILKFCIRYEDEEVAHTAELLRSDLFIPRDIRSGEQYTLPGSPGEYQTFGSESSWTWNTSSGEWECFCAMFSVDSQIELEKIVSRALKSGWLLSEVTDDDFNHVSGYEFYKGAA